ncbi:MAG TPA: ABC transporter ATP-binding protein [Polyangia bacterium]|jgi:oligopeptide transport system ATP-binding protein|nr:ABC transporter ATP-binding protein [Polyangia bacterium]
MTAAPTTPLAPAADNAPLLDVRDLRTYFRTDDGIVKAVDGVSFTLRRGETLGIVGESGSGKSVTSLSLMQLVPRPPAYFPSGQVLFGGQDLMRLREPELRRMRGNRMAMIFQDPMTSLNPYLTVERQLTEVLQLHRGVSRSAARARAIEVLSLVGIPDAAQRVFSHPHEFSGGMRQRVMIAMALLCEPQLLIADEPTTALDVTIQAQILRLIKHLQTTLGTSVILITHDLGVVAGLADRVAVMYAGRIVETGPAADVFASPQHPYTRGLLRSIPRLDRQTAGALTSIPGLPPDLSTLPPGCPFRPRCEVAMDRCAVEFPPQLALGPERDVYCWEAMARHERR